MSSTSIRFGRPPARSARRRRGEGRVATAMLSPALILILLVAAYPIAYAVWLSLNEYSVRVPGLSRFAGLRNYHEAFAAPEFWDALATTFLFGATSVTLELGLGLVMALVMHETFRARGILRTVVLVPWAVLTVVSAIMWRTMFEPQLGLAPSLLEALGLPGRDAVWLAEDGYAMAVMVLADVWKTAPFVALFLLAGLQVISGDLYDAGKVDGATAFQRFRYITLPLLKPAILVALIFRTLDALRVFDLPFVLTGGANGTTTLSLLAHRELTANRLIGYGSALSIVTFAIVMAVSGLYIRAIGGNLRTAAKGAEARGGKAERA